MTSFSMGIALYPEDGGDFDTLFQKADTAMYHAKESGRNAHRFFTEQMNRKVVEHLTLEMQLRKAVEKGHSLNAIQEALEKAGIPAPFSRLKALLGEKGEYASQSGAMESGKTDTSPAAKQQIG